MQESNRNGVVLMKVNKVTSLNVKPTNKKIEKAKIAAENVGILPKEMPLEKKIYIVSQGDVIERIKNSIQIAIDNMRGKQ